MKALYHTLGCKLNYAETSTIERLLSDRGITTVSQGETPDFIIVNSCTVTGEADKKCRQTIRSLGRKHPCASIIVTGCYSQLNAPEASTLPGVVLVVGNDRKDLIGDYLDQWMKEKGSAKTHVIEGKDMERFAPSCARGDRTRWFLKVQDGCDYWCSYCTIPKARGRSRSASISDVISQGERVAAEHGREIVITGVNIGDFGRRNGETFFDLCKALEKVDGIERYRISSIEPNLLTDELLEWIAGESKKFMPHFHIPLQSGSDEVLRLMRRRYDTSLFRQKTELIRRLIPDAFIGVDLIVGARGETPERFEESKRFIEALDISRLHVFTYSERPGTAALNIEPIVSQEEKHRRTRQMLEVSDAKLEDFSQRFIGTIRPVLVEQDNTGHTDNYLRVTLPEDTRIEPNTIVNVRLEEMTTGGEFTAQTIITEK